MPILVAHLLCLISQQTWTDILDHVFIAHLAQLQDRAAPGDPSHIIPDYDTLWWMGHTTIPNEPWRLNRVMECCGFHYEHWLGGVEDDGLILPETVDQTSIPSLMGLRWIQECLVTLIKEQWEGIRDKMGEIQMYTGILTRLQQARERVTESHIWSEHRGPTHQHFLPRAKSQGLWVLDPAPQY
ncbi:uncharacterized protein EDB91DRAFT_1087311 [Suillus paluster]|uniref:uncharacterized protein n=1 Tax=Suillus paluster TaxID=48578 RepID=UPI001B8749FC|nr:uncharacterized protein EDB91DRAFT_1087311 [Suillus paluster]KAG1724881.1 hypothetical protein EDB91DRAFT_1087311 [Suillus paluster]